MRILGIDPGTGRTGWAVIDKTGSKDVLVAAGCIETVVNSPTAERLESIFLKLKSIIEEFKPTNAAVEDLFFFKNAKTVMTVAQARGVILLALELSKIPTANYSPPQVKSAVTGDGRADKASVEKMVSLILKIKQDLEFNDTADAMAVALTHSAVLHSSR